LPSYKGKNTFERFLLRGLIGEVPGQEDRNIMGSTLELQTEEWVSVKIALDSSSFLTRERELSWWT